MKELPLNENITLNVSEGNEIFDFAKKALDNKLYMNGFALEDMLMKMTMAFNSNVKFVKDEIEEKVKDSFIALINFKGKYIGLCLFFKFNRCTIQTFLKPKFRKKGIATKSIKEVLKIIKQRNQRKFVSFYHGNAESIILFYKLWRLKLITLSNILIEDDKNKMRYIKKKYKVTSVFAI